MSDIKHSEIEFTNDDTVQRRAWIKKALDGVRHRFSPGEGLVGASETSGREQTPKRHLRIVDSSRNG